MTGPSTVRVVVGVDGSADSVIALRWAQRESMTRHAQLVAVAAYATSGDPYQGAVGPSPQSVYNRLRAAAADNLALTISETLGDDLQGSVTEVVEPGSPDDVLLVLGEGAALLVVGRGGGDRWLHSPGSTAEHVLRHAPCPVVVVPNEPSAAPGTEAGRVVVAVGETSHSAQTLEFAFETASLRGVGLTAVHCWETPADEIRRKGGHATDLEDVAEQRDRETRFMSEAMAGWTQKFPDVDVREIVIREYAGDAITDKSAGADLLVCGAHRRRVLGALRLGPTTHAAIHDAHCPAAVVPTTVG